MVFVIRGYRDEGVEGLITFSSHITGIRFSNRHLTLIKHCVYLGAHL